MSLDLIVELGNAHEGSLGIATSFVDIVKSTGAKCIKFQMHLPEFESSENEPFRKSFQLKIRHGLIIGIGSVFHLKSGSILFPTQKVQI